MLKQMQRNVPLAHPRGEPIDNDRGFERVIARSPPNYGAAWRVPQRLTAEHLEQLNYPMVSASEEPFGILKLTTQAQAAVDNNPKGVASQPGDKRPGEE